MFNTNRFSKVMLAAIVGFAVIASDNQTFAQGGTWTTQEPMLMTRYYPGAAVHNGSLYVIGGLTADGSNVTSTVEAYAPTANTWIPMASMTTARTRLAAAEIDGLLYAVGGDDNYYGSAHAALEAYDPVTDTWTTMTSMPTARTAPAAGGIGGLLFVVGGQGLDAISPTTIDAYDALEVYDPLTDSWTTMTSMPTARAYSGAGVIDGKLYVVGGLSASRGLLATLEVYDPMADTWTTMAPMPTARMGTGVGVIDGKLYVVGGSTASSLEPFSVFDALEVYDPVSDTWTTNPPMPTPRYGLGTGVIDGLLYVAGGFSSSLEYEDVLEVFSPEALVIDVTIDVKPGSADNTINLKGKGNIPVAILTTAEFDAQDVDPETVLLGQTVWASKFALEDVDLDGDLDLLLFFDQQTLLNAGALDSLTTSLSLTGETDEGDAIEGSDVVKILTK